ncbi:hypothetical protein [Paraclostridium dentum]|uniref:hypothetical protein n=1 Tax=Paraclostridium dentum TaxID=2662455 RepID=UPI003F3DDEAE
MKNIQYLGIAKTFPTNSKYFAETYFSDILKIPDCSKDMNQILSSKVSAHVLNTKLIQTPVKVSNEGQNLQGYKLLVEFEIIQNITYLEYALNCNCYVDNPVRYVTLKDILKSVFIVLPCKLCGEDVEGLIRKNKFKVTPYIENVSIQKISCREVASNVDIFIDVTFNI